MKPVDKKKDYSEQKQMKPVDKIQRKNRMNSHTGGYMGWPSAIRGCAPRPVLSDEEKKKKLNGPSPSSGCVCADWQKIQPLQAGSRMDPPRSPRPPVSSLMNKGTRSTDQSSGSSIWRSRSCRYCCYVLLVPTLKLRIIIQSNLDLSVAVAERFVLAIAS